MLPYENALFSLQTERLGAVYTCSWHWGSSGSYHCPGTLPSVCHYTGRCEQSQALACSNVDVQQLTLKPSSTLANCRGVVDRSIALCVTLEKLMDRVRVLTDSWSESNKSKHENKQKTSSCGVAGMVRSHHRMRILAARNRRGGRRPNLKLSSAGRRHADHFLPNSPRFQTGCGHFFGLSRAASEIANSWNEEKLERLHQVFVVDGNYLVNRSGPRVVAVLLVLGQDIFISL